MQRLGLRRLAACAAAQVLVVIAVAATQPTSGTAAVVAAVVLAPIAVAGVAATAARFADGAFPVAAAAVYVLLPFAANRFVLGPYRASFDRDALPALVGTQHTGWLAIGVGAVVLAAILPERVAAAAGAAVLVAAAVVWSPGALGDVQPLLHETAWSVAFPEWLLVATIAAVVLRRPLLGAAIGSFAVAVLLRASHHAGGVGSFWSAFAPLAPLGAVLVSGVWLLVPRVRLARARRPAS
ncbi:MAG TPA: hypothetical protein VGC78_09195 [Gaiellaceae bacterium]